MCGPNLNKMQYYNKLSSACSENIRTNEILEVITDGNVFKNHFKVAEAMKLRKNVL